MKIRTLIVDDEALARERLRKLLQNEPEIEIVGECANGLEAVARIQEDSPALVFLDVQMPELDGFGVLEQLSLETRPVVIFVTAHDMFAVRAFEVHAIDYLLKPFDRGRFTTALNRAITHIKNCQTSELDRRLTALLADRPPEAKSAERIAIKVGGRVILLKLEEIDWVEAADNYVNLHVGSESHLLRETMNGLETRLPANQFLRISRSTIVNVERIKELQPMFHGEYVVVLRSGAKLTLTRGYRGKLQQLGLS